MGNHVFICYSRKDENFVLELAKNLKSRGVPVWLDQWNIPSGANWDRTIEKALNECDRLLLVLSPSSVDSDEVQCEWRSALDEKKVVVPILHQPCDMPYRLKSIQYIDFTSHSPDDEKSLEQILNALQGSTPKEPLAQPEQPPEKAVQDPKNKKIIIAVAGILLILFIAILSFNMLNSDNGQNTSPVPVLTPSPPASDNGQNTSPVPVLKPNPPASDSGQATSQASALNSKGLSLLYDQYKLDEAMQAFEKAIELDPQYGDAWANKGKVLLLLGNYTESIEAFDKAIEINPQDEYAWANKGASLFNQHKYTESIEAYDKAIEINPQNADTWASKGLALKSLGRTEEANAAFAKAKGMGYTGYTG